MGEGGDVVKIVGAMQIRGELQQMDDVQGNTVYRGRKHAQKRPMGITLLGVLILAGGIFCICAGLSGTPAGILGVALLGKPAALIHFVHAGISIYIFHGFLRLKRSAWIVYMVFLALAIMNNLIMIVSSGSFGLLVPITLMCLFGYYVHGKRELFVN